MIELIYNEEEKCTMEETVPAKPRNVKQVGEPKEYKKIFIEDYVHTFLHQYSAAKGSGTRIAILLGTCERAGGKRHLYIKSALAVDDIAEKQGKYFFSEKKWGDIYQQCEAYFPGQEIAGWFLSKPGFPVENNAVIEETHRTYFSGADKVFFMLEPLEGESAFFGFDGNRFVKQPGYYIYYEKNEPMRSFIMEKNVGQKKESEAEKPDIAMANFRKILQEKQAKNVKRKKMVISYGMKVSILLVLFVGAVTLKNQTDQIQTMEKQMNELSEKGAVQKASSDEVIVEELPGDVEEQPQAVYQEPEVSEERSEELPVTEPEEADKESIEEPAEEANEEPVEEAAEEANEEPAKEPVEEAAVQTPVYEEYTVQPGDTLAKISRDKYGSDEMIDEICKLNEIQDGDYIQVGEIILLP